MDGLKQNRLQKVTNMDKHIQNYTCEDGAIAKFIIPIDATEDDLSAISEILDAIIKYHFKVR